VSRLYEFALGGEAGDADERFGGVAAKQWKRLRYKMRQFEV